MTALTTTLPAVADHGTFTIPTPIERELVLLRDAWRLAAANPRQPGHHWHRIVARPRSGDGPVITKVWHVDRTAGLVEVTETRDGRETARCTLRFGG